MPGVPRKPHDPTALALSVAAALSKMTSSADN